MASVDEKVVRMTFDNAKFEAGVQKTLETLAKLKSALNLDKAGSDFEKLQQASNKVNFSHMSDALDQVSNRFSTFGIVGMTVLQNLTTTAMNTAKNILSALTNPLIQGGKRRALNIEQAKFQIEGLGYAWEDVAEDINYGVKSTAYGLDSAAKAASQLLASNVKVGDSMKAALRGISGVAAMTSSEYDDIARVFTTVAGNGRLMGDQLNQLSARGLNVAATLGKALGKTEGEIREMVSKGQIDFATFSKAMDDAFGEHAKKANDTFTGALSNMKAALSRIGAEFATPAYTNLRHAMNALTPAIDDVKKALGPLYETASKAMEAASNLAVNILGNLNLQDKLAGPMEAANKIAIAFGKTIVNLGKAIYRIVAPVVSAFDKAFGGTLIDIMVRAAEAIADFTSKLVISERMSTNIERTFIGVFTILSVVSDILSRVAGFITGILWNAITGVFGFFFDIATSITAVVGDLIVGVKNLVDEIMSLRFVQAIIGAVEKAMEAIGFASDVAYKGVQGFADSLFDKTFETSALVLSKLADVIRLVAHALDDAIYKAAGFIKKLRELPATQRAIQKVTTTFGTLRTNVLNVSSSLASKLYPAFTKAKSIISQLITNIRDLIDRYVEIPTVQDLATKAIEFGLEVLDKGIEIFEKVKTVVGEIVDRVKDLTSVSLSNVGKNFKDLRDKISETIDMAGKLEWVKNLFYDIRDGMIEMSNTSGSILNRVKEKLSQFIGWLETKFSNISLGDLIAAGAGGSLIAFMLTFSKFMTTAEKLAKNATTMIDKIAGLPGAVANVMSEFAKTMKAKRQASTLDSISTLIKNIALLAASIAVLATMDQEKVKSSAIVIGILGASLIAIAGIMQAISGTATPDQVAKASALMLSIGGAMALLVIAFKILSKIKMEGIETKLVAMGILMAEMAAFTILLNKFTPEITAGMPSIMAIGFSLVLLTKAMSNIAAMDVSSLTTSVAVLGVLMAVMTVITRMSAAENAEKGAAAFLGMSVAIVLMVKAIKDISDMDPQKAAGGIGAILVLMLGLETFMIASARSGKYAHKAAVALLAVGASLILITEAIKRMADIDHSMIQTATDVVTRVLVLFALLTAMTRLAGKNGVQAGAAIVLMSGSLILIAGAIAIMAKIDPEGLKRGVNAVTQIMAMFAMLVAATGVAKNAQKMIVTMTICIAALAGALAVLSLLEPTNLATASMALNSLIVCFTLLVAATSIAKRANSAILPLVAVVGILAMLLAQMAKIDADIKKALIAAEAISLLVVSLSAALVALQFVKVSAAVEGIAALAIVIVALGALLAALGALNQAVPEALSFIESGIPVFEAIGEAIGRFVGALVGGLAGSAIEGFSESIVKFGDNLSRFAEAIQPFLDTMSNIPDAAVEGAGKVVAMLLMITAADLINSLASAFSFFTGESSITEVFQKILPILAEGMKGFVENLGPVDLAKISVAAEAAKKIAEMMAIMPRSGGVFELFAGGIDMGKLSKGLVQFGIALTAYSMAVKNLDAASVNASIEPAKSIIEVSKMIAAEGGILQDWLGSQAKGMAALSENLVNFGTALVDYGNTVKSLYSDKVTKSIEPAKGLIEVANAISSEGGILQGWIGSKAEGMIALSGNLVDFGKALREYSSQVYNLSGKAIKTSIEPAKSLIELSNLIHEEGGFLQAVFGSESKGFSDFNDNVTGLGEALVSFSEKSQSLKDCSKALDVAETLAGVWQAIGTENFWEQVYDEKEVAVNTFYTFCSGIGEAFKAFGDAVDGIKTGGLSGSKVVAETLKDIYESMGAEGGFQGWLNGTKGESFKNIAQNAGALGQSLVRFSWYANGIKTDGVDDAVDIVKKLVEIYNSVKESGGWAAVVGGDATETISKGLPALGKALADFASKVSAGEGVDLDRVRNACGAIVAIGKSFEGFDWQNISYAAYLDQVGESIRGMSDELGQVDFDRITNGMRSLNGMSTTLKNLVGADTSGLDRIKESLSSFIEIVNNDFIKKLDEKVKEVETKAGYLGSKAGSAFLLGITFSVATISTAGSTLVQTFVSGMDASMGLARSKAAEIVNAIVIAVNWKGGDLSNAGKGIVTKISDGINNNQSIVITSANKLVDVIKSAVTKKLSQFTDIGKQMVTNIRSGFTLNASSIVTTVSNTISNAANGVSTYSFYKLGKYAMQGLANGMKDNAYIVSNASKVAATNALTAANRALEVRSPSRKFYKTGRWTMIGLANGISENSKYAISESQKAATDILDYTNKIMDGIDLSDAMNYNPVITPVVDMTNVKSAGGTIGDLLSSDVEIGGSKEVNLASRSFDLMARRSMDSQNAIFESNRQVVAAIDDLKSTVADLPNEIQTQVDLYMDKKLVASSLTPEINKQLGILAKRGGLS